MPVNQPTTVTLSGEEEAIVETAPLDLRVEDVVDLHGKLRSEASCQRLCGLNFHNKLARGHDHIVTLRQLRAVCRKETKSISREIGPRTVDSSGCVEEIVAADEQGVRCQRGELRLGGSGSQEIGCMPVRDPRLGHQNVMAQHAVD